MYEVNQTIYHEKFGRGVITKIEPRENYLGRELPPLVFVNFEQDNSTKRFIPDSLTQHLRK